MADPISRLNEHLGGRYEIVREIGRGGMATVFLAADLRKGGAVALKVLRPEMTGLLGPTRFLKEIEVTASLKHPCILPLLDSGEAGGFLFYAMPYVRGESLSTHLTREGQLSIERSVRITRDVASGLGVAHARGIVHRDVKPANILLEGDRAIVTDFGVAKAVDVAADVTRLTQTGTAIGTLPYLSPEQAAGDKEIDGRSDIYSLGCVFYEMLSGRLPFPQQSAPAILYAILNEAPEPPSELRQDLPREVERVALKCLRKDPDDRYASTAELCVELEALLEPSEDRRTTEVAGQPGPSPPQALSSEHQFRRATVLLAEVSSEGPLAAFPAECLADCRAIIHKYEGIVAQVTGNRITAIFGLPVALEDAPRRAVNAAIELRNRVSGAPDREGRPLEIRVGIGTDRMASPAGAAATDDGAGPAGVAVDLAGELLSIGRGGQIMVGPVTRRHTMGDFRFVPSGPRHTSDEATEAFELLSTEERVGRRSATSERIVHSTMVGRDQELNRLELQLLKVANGEGSVVQVVGEAGIGKSRLVAELKNRDVSKKATWLEGSAVSIGHNLSYHPVIGALRNWAGLGDDDRDVIARSKLESAIRDVHPSGVDEIFPFIAKMLGLKLTGKHAERAESIEGEAMERVLIRSVRELLIHAASARPIVFMVEDVHWADLSSIELLESVLRLAKDHDILFLFLLRPGFSIGERFMETSRQRCEGFHVEVVLSPLGDRESRYLIENIVQGGAIPTRIIETIAKRADGNPFFLEEVLRSFIDEGVVELHRGAFRATSKIDTVVIPETIHDLLLARIDSLTDAPKALLQQASVIGRSFFRRILMEIVDRPEAVDEGLEYLERVELIEERQRLGEVECVFKHALVHDVAYESLTLDARRGLHLKVAKAIEGLFASRLNEFYGTLAFHYSQAEQAQEAEHYLVRAGEEALKVAASREALHYYREALSLYRRKHGAAADPDRIAQLEQNIGIALFNKGHMREAVEYFDRVLAHLGLYAPQSRVALAGRLVKDLLQLMRALYLSPTKRGRPPTETDNHIINLVNSRGLALGQIDARRLFLDSIGTLARLSRLDLRAVRNGSAIFSISSALFSFTGLSFPLSGRVLRHAKPHVPKDDAKTAFVYRYSELLHNFFSGEWRAEPNHPEDLIRENLANGEVFYVSAYLLWHALMAIEQGEFDHAADVVGELSDIGESYDNDLTRTRSFVVNAKLRLTQRSLEDARRQLDTGMDFVEGEAQNHFSIMLAGMQPYAQVLHRDFDGAQESLRYARELLDREARILPLQANNLLLSQLLYDIVRLEEAVEEGNEDGVRHLARAAHRSGLAAIKNARHYAAGRTEAYRLMGLGQWLVGRHGRALKYWTAGLRHGMALDARPEIGRLYAEAGRRLQGESSGFRELDGCDARTCLERARRTFTELRLEHDLEMMTT